MFQKRLTYIAIIFILTITVISIEGTQNNISEGNEVNAAVQTKNETKILTDEIVKEKTKAFKENLIQETNDNGKVKAYETKEAFIKSFDSIASPDALPQFTDILYEEREDGLYLSSLDTPPWFNPHNEYDMIELDENTYDVKQENTSALNGVYNISFTFTYDDGWKITNVEYK